MPCTLFSCLCTGNFRKGFKGCCVWKPYCTFSSSFSATVTTSFRDAPVIAYACAFTNPFSHGFRPYMKVCMALSVGRCGNTTTILSNWVMYSCTVPCYRSFCNLSRATFLSSKNAYWSMNMRSKSGNIAGTSPYTSRRSIQHAAVPPIKAILDWHACTVLLPVYGIRTAMK